MSGNETIRNGKSRRYATNWVKKEILRSFGPYYCITPIHQQLHESFVCWLRPYFVAKAGWHEEVQRDQVKDQMCKSLHRMSFLQLPQELLQYIIRFVHDHDLKHLEATCSTLYKLSNESFLWRERCQRFLYWEDSSLNTMSTTADEYLDWKAIFTRRLAIEAQTTLYLEAIITTSHGRIANFECITRFGYDAKDCLLTHLDTPDTAEDVLARRYHAQAAISCIHRRHAVKEWSKIAKGEDVGLTSAIAGFDLFILEDHRADTQFILSQLDDLSQRFLNLHIDWDDLQVKKKALLLAEFLRAEGFIGSAYEDYYDLRNSFLGHALRNQRTTLPIISSILFCSVAERVRIRALPCEASYHVYTMVILENGQYLYLDTYRHAKSMDEDELKVQLTEIGAATTSQDLSIYLRPASTRTLLLRSAANIQNSIYRGSGANRTTSTTICQNAAEYAAVCAFALLGGRMSARTLESLCRCLHEEFFADIGFVEQEILPFLTSEQSSLLRRFCGALRNEDNTLKRENQRNTPEAKAIKYSVGTVFRHRKYHWEGIITGWTLNCKADGLQNETLRMQQPFYYALVEDCSMRYVADENIFQIHPSDGGHLLEIAGKYFKRYDKVAGTYISNITQEYPDG